MQTATTGKSAISLRIDVETKQALQELAEKENRSIHYMAVQMLDRAVKEQLHYQKMLEKDIMQASDNLHENGSSGISASEAHKNALEYAKMFLAR
ncbi:ribbon-helix-helix domain-containing protein [Moraxella nasovis]|uniref:CopG family ribbon-helix-helix protein n=1 Tax=Moraxella nasovis TaxID=2904121 RepID=UPI001F625712|nr:ribbon-helix-helix domain-containing protein [Moraxella nasovis]UNU73167.1 ribbon-helix-helix domain-containing protein [Moraxella nasovis]